MRASGPTRPWRLGYLAPLMVVLAVTTIVPNVYSIAMSLGTAQGSLALERPVGLDNYREVLTAAQTWESLRLAAAFLVAALTLEMVLGTITALLVHRYLPAGGGLRILLLWPAVLPPIAVALIFKFILQGDVGMISYYLAQVGYRQAWLTNPTGALGVIIAIDVWQYTPFVILLTLAALQAVPDENYEAAALDGAGGARLAWFVQLPMVRPALVSVLLLRLIDAIQVFPTIYVLTRGGPGASTQLIAYYTFSVFFGELRFGIGAVLSVLVVTFTVVCVIVVLSWQRRLERP